ncbi:MAG: DUF4437 domain-containing protein [Cyanobacteria bacterium P01_H01_bin.15]
MFGKKNLKAFFGLILALLIVVWSSLQVKSHDLKREPNAGNASQVVSISDVEWGALNPARGDQSPKAATLWGDRTASGPSGFLVQFVEDFSSPPHIHNVSYRGVVISGLIHNDDPNAENLWLPQSSFWTQPAGDVHITAADSTNNLAYIEIEDGPYLVMPAEEAFDNGERPVNIDESNLIWLDASNILWIDQSGGTNATLETQLAFLWGSPQGNQLNGTLVKLPIGFKGELHSQGPIFRAIVIQGQPNYQGSDGSGIKVLEPGSYFGSEGETIHQLACAAEEECIIYVRQKGKYSVIAK